MWKPGWFSMKGWRVEQFSKAVQGQQIQDPSTRSSSERIYRMYEELPMLWALCMVDCQLECEEAIVMKKVMIEGSQTIMRSIISIKFHNIKEGQQITSLQRLQNNDRVGKDTHRLYCIILGPLETNQRCFNPIP